MTTNDSKPSTAAQPLMDQRLDAIDRALLGILPRSERLAIVAQVETRVRELTDGDTAADSVAASAMEPEVLTDAVSRRAASASPKRRSRLALSSGILGIVALVMLFAMPITYFLVVSIGEDFGEFISIGLLSIHVLAVAIGGLVALVMAIAGLVSLSRRKGRLVGHGWAITGLCTAPLPTLVGGLMVLVTGFSLFALQSVTVESVPSSRGVVVSPSQPTYYASPAVSCAPASPMPPPLPASYSSGPATCAPAPSIPPPSLSMPLPVSAAPSFCPSGEVCSPSVRAAYSDDVLTGPTAPPSGVVPAAPAPSSSSYSPAALPPSNFTEQSPSNSNKLTPAVITPGASVSPSAAPIPSPSGPRLPAESIDPPSDDEVLRALDKAKPTQGGFLHSVERNNVRIVKEKVSDFADPPLFAPLCGPVQLHHARYKCTVFYTEVTRAGFPASSTVNEDALAVIYIDRNHLQLLGNVVSGGEASYYY